MTPSQRPRNNDFKTHSAKRLIAFAGTETVQEAIPLCVNKLRQKAIARGLDNGQPPYDPHSLAQVLGVYEVRKRTLDCDGRIVRGPAGFAIELNSQAGQSARSRFTFAHEVAHLILWECSGATRALVARREGKHSEIERLCDLLAAEMLVPEADLRILFRDRKAGFPPAAKAIVSVAEKFKTSLQFAAFRLRSVLKVRFGTGLANISAGYWDWQFGIGTPASLLEILRAREEPRTKDARRLEYFDDARRRPISFDAVRVGPDRTLVVTV